MADVQEAALADVYAQALYALADKAGVAHDVEEELADFVRYLDQNNDFFDFLTNPRLDVEHRQPVLERLFSGKLSDLFLDTLQVLNRRSRLNLLPAVAERFRLIHEERHGEIEVQVTSATPLNEELRGRLIQEMSEFTSRKARLIEHTDEALIGGLVVHVGDTKLDASVAHSLKQVHDALEVRGSHEIYGGRFLEAQSSTL